MKLRHFISIFLVVLLSACGVYSFKGTTINPDTKTVMIDYFPNRASLVNPSLSQDFVQLLQDKFQRETNLDIVNEKDEADLVFEGHIKDYRIAPASLSSQNDIAVLTRLTISIDVKFTDNKNEENNFSTSISRFYDFESSLSLSDVEEEAVEDINGQIIQDIFDKAFSNW